MYPDRKCVAPNCSGSDSQIHIWSCKFLEENTTICATDCKYEDIFSNDINKQVQVMQIMMQHYRKRLTYMSSPPSGDDPA